VATAGTLECMNVTTEILRTAMAAMNSAEWSGDGSAIMGARYKKTAVLRFVETDLTSFSTLVMTETFLSLMAVMSFAT